MIHSEQLLLNRDIFPSRHCTVCRFRVSCMAGNLITVAMKRDRSVYVLHKPVVGLFEIYAIENLAMRTLIITSFDLLPQPFPTQRYVFYSNLG